jgi:vacuolar-type H+-ATPase subunit F/Vma7
MSRVFVIGRRADALPFKAAGAQVIEAEDCVGAAEGLRSIMQTAGPCLVMVSEDLARGCREEIAQFREGKERSVVSLPTLSTKPGTTLADIRAMVARSIGVDLLGKQG